MTSKNPTSIQKILDKAPSLGVHDPNRTTDMKITGTINQEDGSIFLKVFISDKTGKARNIYFPFDIESDTAHDVATEMVKELEINDWEPLDIAEMIDKEIANLIPAWKKGPMDLLQNLDNHSFCYDENDDDDTPHPFHSTSSQSSPQASPRSLGTVNWTPGNLCFEDYDDGRSQSSLASYNCSNFTYCSENEDEYQSSSFPSQYPQQPAKTNNLTRFCGEERVTTRCNA
ncbi:putative serine/threonine-protein kinase WNK4 [Bidens hawaiensis]|uniref:putative serine/threonine-protein kinase WNK4 n=1 Tax=Bidens hawaiensis TaxID=980011 RepID=UPI00404BA444